MMRRDHIRKGLALFWLAVSWLIIVLFVLSRVFLAQTQ